MTQELRTEDHILEKEACIYGRYLLDRDPSEELVERYIRANRVLGTDRISPVDARVLEFAGSHQWSVPLLDAGTGFLKIDSLLRKKIFIMAAILETSPGTAGEFLPEVLSPFVLILKLLADGLVAGVKVLIGVPLCLILRGRGCD